MTHTVSQRNCDMQHTNLQSEEIPMKLDKQSFPHCIYINGSLGSIEKNSSLFDVCILLDFDWNKQTHFIIIVPGCFIKRKRNSALFVTIEQCKQSISNANSKNNSKCRQIYIRNVNLHSTQSNTSNDDKW